MKFQLIQSEIKLNLRMLHQKKNSHNTWGKKRFSKSILSQETKKVTNSITDTNNKTLLKLTNFRKNQKCFYFCSRYCPKNNFRNKNKLKKCKQQKWFNTNCQQIRKNLNWLGHVLIKNPNHHFFSGQYFNLKIRYRKRC